MEMHIAIMNGLQKKGRRGIFFFSLAFHFKAFLADEKLERKTYLEMKEILLLFQDPEPEEDDDKDKKKDKDKDKKDKDKKDKDKDKDKDKKDKDKDKKDEKKK